MVNKLRIALYDSSGYMTRLAEYICRKGYQMLETKLYTNLPFLKKCAAAGEIDVLLAGEEVAEEIAGLEADISQVILLTEGKGINPPPAYTLVFKYQPAQNIVQEILSHVAENDEIHVTQWTYRRKRIEFIGVYAPFGGGGVTTYALTAAKELSERHRVLYISLELFCGLDMFFSEGKHQEIISERGMSEVIFYLKQRKDKLAMKLESLISVIDGVRGILAVEDYRDLYQMTKEDMELFLDVLEKQTEYEKIIFDIGYLSDTILFLMSQCTRIYMPKAITESQQSKKRAFERLLIRENNTRISENIQEME